MTVSDPTCGERLAAWLATERREGESIALATARFRTSEFRSSIAAIRFAKAGAPVPAPFVPLVDDGLTDRKWRNRNLNRRYRVRPWRPVDGSPATFRYPCFTVFDVTTKRGTWGIPIDALHNIGFPAQPEDSDAFGEFVLLAFEASSGFRQKCPGFAG